MPHIAIASMANSMIALLVSVMVKYFKSTSPRILLSYTIAVN